ncbi:unnamed protein product [Ixodes pacificus]
MKWFAVFVAVWASATLAAGQESSTGTSHAPTTHAPTTHAPTTHAPTTHAPTTHAPTTHAPTTLAPTTTAAPPTPPVPPVNKYVLRDADNQTCVMVTAALQLKVSYLAKDSKWRDALLVLDNTTTVDPANSSCGHSEQTLALRCGTSLLSLTFTKNETNFLSGIVAEYVLDTAHFPDAQHQGELVKVGNESLHLFGVEQGRSYLCGADSPVPLGGNTTLDVLNVQLQAFVNATVQPEGFGSAVHCVQNNDISNIVPIAVGSALAALVVIVLLAYLVGRSRSRQKGYQSV